MKLKTLFEAIHESPSLSTAEELKRSCEIIIRVQDMDSGERDTLKAAWQNGPLWDGDVPSKTARDKLVFDGYIAKVVVKGQDGYNACTYLGHQAYRLIAAGA
jgi:hypothetical protein